MGHGYQRRLPGWDYRQPGVYFLTVVAADRLRHFGRVADAEVELTDAGRIVEEEWLALPAQFASLRVDAFVVMPDHLHGILELGGGAPGGLSEVMRRFKARTTRRINLLRASPGRPLWQRSFHERIVRGRGDLERMRLYIAGNPARWNS